MGWAERANPNSEWNKRRALNMNFSSQATFKQNQALTPTKDEPMVIQITPARIFTAFKEFLCRLLHLRPQSPAPTS